MSITIHSLSLGKLATNCIIIRDEDSKQAIIIDPADSAPDILAAVEGYDVREILLTHAHFDHVLASKPVKEATGAPLRVHENDIPQLEHTQQIAMMFGMRVPNAASHDILLHDGDVIEVGAIRLETIFTPGHSPGHVVFVLHSEKAVINGDCIFAGAIGRTDFPGSVHIDLVNSIVNKILPIGDEYTLYVGHGPHTTIGHERKTNPFILEFLRDQL